MHIVGNPVVGAEGAVDLDKPPCGSCRWRTMGGLCRRYPPIFIPPIPVPQPNGQVGMQQATWAFPPAVVRCGEWTQPNSE
jgi:hypothetical protein